MTKDGEKDARTGASWLEISGVMVFPAVSAAGLTMPLVALPPFLHDQLGYDGFLIGLVLSAYAVSTLISRPISGRVADTAGVKTGVTIGLLTCALSGLLMGLAPLFANHPMLALPLLLASRISLGVGLAMTNTAALSWLFAAAGPDRAARAIGYNGVIGYSTMAFSPTLGQWLGETYGLWSIGLALLAANVAGLLVLLGKNAPETAKGAPMSFRSTFSRVALLGLALGLGSIGMSVISTFSSLVFVQNRWEHAAWSVMAFGAAYIAPRLIISDAVKRFGAQRVTFFCFVTQAFGYAALWLSPSPHAAILAAGVTGLGMSFLYPALSVEVVTRVPAANRSSALGAFSMCLDVSIGVATPLCGAVASLTGDFSSAYCFAGLMALTGIFISPRLYRAPASATSSASQS